MEHDKFKSEANQNKSSIKSQQRHHEHNYTNPPMEEMTTGTKSGSMTGIAKAEAINYQTRSSVTSGEGHRTKNSGSKAQGRMETVTTRQTTQTSTSAVPADRHLLEVKNRVIKKDVFNRIRRSEEELQKAAEMVRGGMTFQTASDTFNIPISTIRFYMARRGILPQRRRGRGSSGVRDDDLIHPPFEIIHYRLPDIDKPV